MNKLKDIKSHFSKIAPKYRDLRTTDLEPILYIKEKLKKLSKIIALDVGCGTGRYDIKLFEHLEKRLFLTSIDENKEMLDELMKISKKRKIKNFNIIKSSAERLALDKEIFDCILTFNAIHHFKILDFLKEGIRVLKDNGYLFIYTRLRSQNKRNIWGKYFPKFYKKENRLYELGELKKIFTQVVGLKLSSIKYFKYKRVSNLEWLTLQAVNHHYSTFFLYNEKEFNECLKKFQSNIKYQFKDLNKVAWEDEYTMFTLKKLKEENCNTTINKG
jgi:ubiquinone/menaquinone biosynthesis C-methylase UbiE